MIRHASEGPLAQQPGPQGGTIATLQPECHGRVFCSAWVRPHLFEGNRRQTFESLIGWIHYYPDRLECRHPKRGSVPGAAKITRPAVVSPMNSIRTKPKGYSLIVPS